MKIGTLSSRDSINIKQINAISPSGYAMPCVVTGRRCSISV
jgi:hypothetical protein